MVLCSEKFMRWGRSPSSSPTSNKPVKRDSSAPQRPHPPPPPYAGTHPTDEDVSDAVAAWDRNLTKKWPSYNLTFDFVPAWRQGMSLKRMFRNCKKQPAWEAKLYVNAKNIPRLMQGGFNWSSANIINSRGQLICGSHDLPGKAGKGKRWRHTQTYRLRNLDGDAGGGWEASLHVYGRLARTVLHFDISCITDETTWIVMAKDRDDNVVYYADKREGLLSNAIFYNMPLASWWPGLEWKRESK